MDGKRFDRLMRLLATAHSRRGLLSLLTFLPLGSTLTAWLAVDEGEAAGRRDKHRRQRHHANRHPHRAEANKRKKKHKHKNKKKKQTCAQAGQAPWNSKVECCSGLVLDDSGICNASSCAGGCAGCCNGLCVDTSTNPDHCGGCGNSCGDGQICQAGVCGVSCGDDFCPAATSICVGETCAACTVCQTCVSTTVANGIAAATDGDTVYVCAGTYNAGATTTIGKNLTLIGAGSGSSPASNTILDGTGSNVSVLQISDNFTVSIQNLRIRGGKGTQPSGGSSSGGGIRNEGDLTLTRVVVTENTADIGGGIHQKPNAGAKLTLNTGAQIVGNTASGDAGQGGGIYSGSGASVTMKSGSAVSDNSATSNGGSATSAGLGGGIYNFSTVLTLEDGSTVEEDWAEHQGGGIFSSGSGSTFTLKSGSTVRNNGTSNGTTVTLRGGGIANTFASKVVMESGSLVENNAATELGGGIYNTFQGPNKGNVTLHTDSAVTGNSAGTGTNKGGGVYNDNATLTVDSASIITASNTPDRCISTPAMTPVTNCNA